MNNPFDLIDARLSKIEELLLDIKHPKIVSASPTIPEKKYLTREEAANLLDVSLHTLNKWTKEGRVKGYRIGSRVRYVASELGNSLSLIAV